MSFKVVDDLTGTTGADATWTAPTQQVTIVEASNPRFPRLVQLSNNGVKVIHASGAVGFALADLIAIAVAVNPDLTWPPRITTQPLNASAHDGQPASFAIVATSEITLSYQWKHSTNGGTSYSNLSNAGVFSGVTTATLAISEVAGLDGHLYLCIATNGAGSTTSRSAKLVVTGTAPVIETQPTDQIINHPSTDNADFDVVAVSSLAMTYQWQVSTDGGTVWTNVSNGGHYAGVTTATMTFTTEDSEGDGWKFRVRVTNSAGTTNSAAADLNVS